MTAVWLDENLRLSSCCFLIASIPSFSLSMVLESKLSREARSSRRASGGRSTTIEQQGLVRVKNCREVVFLDIENQKELSKVNTFKFFLSRFQKPWLLSKQSFGFVRKYFTSFCLKFLFLENKRNFQ